MYLQLAKYEILTYFKFDKHRVTLGCARYRQRLNSLLLLFCFVSTHAIYSITLFKLNKSFA